MNETPDPVQAAAENPAAAPSIETQFAELQARHTEVSDAYLRAKAEAENTRRRAEEEISKARKFAVEGFAPTTSIRSKTTTLFMDKKKSSPSSASSSWS